MRREPQSLRTGSQQPSGLAGPRASPADPVLPTLSSAGPRARPREEVLGSGQKDYLRSLGLLVRGRLEDTVLGPQVRPTAETQPSEACAAPGRDQQCARADASSGNPPEVKPGELDFFPALGVSVPGLPACVIRPGAVVPVGHPSWTCCGTARRTWMR